MAKLAFLFGAILWLPKRNYRTAGKPSELTSIQASLKAFAWREDSPAHVEPVKGSGVDPNDVLVAMAERQIIWDRLKVSSSPENQVRLKVFRELFVDQNKDVLIQPEYLGVTGFQRSSVYMTAMVDRLIDQEFGDKEVVSLIPVLVSTFSDPFQRLEAQVLENGIQTARAQVKELDILKPAADLIQNRGWNEYRVQTAFNMGRTTGQKVYAIARLHLKFPDVGVIPRMLVSPKDEGFVSYGKIDKEAVRRLKDRTETRKLSEMAEKAKAENRQLKPEETPATEEEVKLFFDNVGKVPNAPKRIGDAKLKDIAEISHNDVLKGFIEDVTTAGSGTITLLNSSASAWNALRKLILEQDLTEEVTGLLTSLLSFSEEWKEEDRSTLIPSWLKTLEPK